MEWKRFKDEKPNLGDKILIYGYQTDHYFILTSIVYEGIINDAVTHWSYIPDQPERLNGETQDLVFKGPLEMKGATIISEGSIKFEC